MLGCHKLSFFSFGVYKGSDCFLTWCSIRAVIQEFNDDKEASTSSELHSAVLASLSSLKTSKASESKDQASSKRPAQLALFTGVYISLVGMALLVFPTSLFGEAPIIFRYLSHIRIVWLAQHEVIFHLQKLFGSHVA